MDNSSNNNTSSEFTVDGEEQRDEEIDMKKNMQMRFYQRKREEKTEGRADEKANTDNGENLEKIADGKQMQCGTEALGDGDANVSVRSPRQCFGVVSRLAVPPALDTAMQKKLSAEYLAHLLEEKRGLGTLPNSFDFKHLTRLVDEEILKVSAELGELPVHQLTSRLMDGTAGRIQACGDGASPKLGRRMLVQEKVFVPVHEYPDYNFVGRILGPRGMTAKQLEEETGCRIMIRGRGSTRDEGVDPQRGSSVSPKEELHVLIQCEDYELTAKAKLKHAVECIRLMLKPPPHGEDELKRQQLMQLAIINGTYRPTNSLKMALHNQNILSPLSFFGFPVAMPNNGTPTLTSNNTPIGNEANKNTKNMHVPLNNSAGVNVTSLSNAASLGIGTSALGRNDAQKRFVKTNSTASTIAQMGGNAQTSSLMTQTSTFNPQLMNPMTMSNMLNPQLASAILSGLANSSNVFAKEYYKQMLASLNLGTSVVNGGLSMGASSSASGSPNTGVRPFNLQGYLTATSMLNDAPCLTNGLSANTFKRPR